MSILLGTILVAVVALYVAMPFFIAETDETEPEPLPESPRDRLEHQKREAYAAIKEAEFDHEMGKLSDTDFEALTGKYRAQALAAIAAIEGGSEVGGATAPDRNPVRVAFCATCGRKLPAKANFCPDCGRAIKVDRELLTTDRRTAVNQVVAQTG